MEAPRLLAVAVVAVAAMLLVPTFNALNEERLGDAKPPIEIKDPPPDIQPPPDFEPPPTPPPCDPGERVLYDEAFGGNGGDTAEILLPEGTAVVLAGGQFQNYRGDASIRFVSPGGTVVLSNGTTTQSTLLSPSNEAFGNTASAEEGVWRLTIVSSGLTGGFRVGVVAAGCFPNGNAPEAR